MIATFGWMLAAAWMTLLGVLFPSRRDGSTEATILLAVLSLLYLGILIGGVL